MTATTPATSADGGDAADWIWPLDLARYDRRPLLAHAEANVLGALGIEQVRRLGLTPQAAPRRLVEPLAHARDCFRWAPGTGNQRRFARDAAGLVLVRCGELGRSYWGWSDQDWADLIDPSGAEFRRRWGGQIGPNARPFVIAYAYLLGGFTAFEQVGRFQRPTLAHRVFGESAVDAAVGKVLAVLGNWGYQRRPSRLTSAVCQILLLNRSPRLEDLTSPALDAVHASAAMRESEWASDLHGIQRAVAALGHADPPPRPRHGPGPTAIEGAAASWADWVERWHVTSTLTPRIRANYRSVLAKIGRWLAAEHPEVTGPELWTRQTCASWVAAVDRMKVGDYSQWTAGMRSQGRIGKPLTPQAKSGYLKVPRAFFRDLHEWEWIPQRFNPAHALRTPRSVQALMGPDPRVIADDIWAKLLWAGLNVESGDLPTADGRTYPAELIRAITVTWLFAGQRSDEVARLRVGCIRWQHDGMPIPGDSGEVLARDAVCLLDVPTHKTGTAFTKPVDPLLGQAIEAWQAVRPDQPAIVDPKTNERVDLLFAFRARRVSKHYINETIIPMLCRKAGVPTADVRGNITSHRARSTSPASSTTPRSP